MHGQLKGLLKYLYKRAYFYPDICIRLSKYNPEDGKLLLCKKEYIVPNGLADFAVPYLHLSKVKKTVTILSVGVLCESKGVLILLESIYLLARKDYQFKVQFMGRFESDLFRQRVNDYIAKHNLTSYVQLIGVQTGSQKYQTFTQADIFCFPTFFEAETFGLVALEAMQFQLPVVATRWRGVPSVVEDKVSGFLVPTRDANALAEKLEILMNDPELRSQMGNAGRKIYLENFTSEKHYQQLEDVFSLA
jgi:glycosyltransferase involved in cell wall biosynthesis